MTTLEERIIARVKFAPGITEERILAACRSAENPEPIRYIQNTIAELVRDGEIQKYHPPTAAAPTYHPADWEPPTKTLFKPKSTTMKQTREPFISPEAAAPRGDAMTQALWDALAIFEKRGEPFTKTDLLNYLETSSMVLKARSEVNEAIEEAIARLGKPDPVERRKEAAKRNRTTRNAAKAVTPTPTLTIEEPTMTPLANITIEQKQVEVQQRINDDKQFAHGLSHQIGELMRGAGRLDEEIEELTQRLAEARADRERYQKLLDGALALQEYVSPCLEEPELPELDAEAA